VSADEYIMIKDEYDIWQVDPNGEEQPKNITNGYGRKNKTEFNYTKLDPKKRFLEPGEKFLLLAQNKNNKQAGLFMKESDCGERPETFDYGHICERPGAKGKKC
jgi:hypothetical protein